MLQSPVSSHLHSFIPKCAFQPTLIEYTLYIYTLPTNLETQFHTHITAVKVTSSNPHLSFWVTKNLVLFDFCKRRGLISYRQ
jgi:hypothetical protein